jgi:hypothetical protein
MNIQEILYTELLDRRLIPIQIGTHPFTYAELHAELLRRLEAGERAQAMNDRQHEVICKLEDKLSDLQARYDKMCEACRYTDKEWDGEDINFGERSAAERILQAGSKGGKISDGGSRSIT